MPEEKQFNALLFHIYSIHMYAYISSLRSLLIAFPLDAFETLFI